MTDSRGIWHQVTNCVDQGILNNAYYVIGSAVVPCLMEHGNLRSTAITYSPVNLVTYTLPSSLTRTLVVPAQHVTTSTLCDYVAPTICATSEVERAYEGVFLNVTRVTERTSSLPGVERVTTTSYFDNIGSSGPYLMGLPEQITVSVGSDSVVSTHTYDEDTGFLLARTSAGVTTTFATDARGNVASVTDAFGTAQASTSTFVYDWGVIQESTSAFGTSAAQTTMRLINADGFVASETAGYGSLHPRTTSFTYYPDGRVQQVTPPGDSASSIIEYDMTWGLWERATRGSERMETTFDGFGRPVLTVTGTTAAYMTQATTSYDADGRVRHAGLPVAFGSSANPGTTLTYNDAALLVTQTLADDAVSSQRLGVHVDGAARSVKTTTTDEKNRQTIAIEQGFDGALGRLVDAAGQTWNYTYDHITGALTQVAGPNNVTRSWVYASGTKRLQTETHPESGTVTYQEYWADGLLRKKQDANGTVFEYAYDGAGRPTEIKTTAGAAVETTTIQYEPGSDLPAEFETPDVVSTLDYDTTGRLVSRTDSVDANTFVTAFAYDGQDNLTQITYPSQRVIKYAYDGANRLVAVCRAVAVPCAATTPLSETYARGFEYEPSGALRTYVAGNGVVTELTYDAARAWVRTITAGAGPTALELTYDYDEVGNITSIADGTRPAWNQAFTYDDVDRLRTASSAGAYGVLAWTYDAHGNRQTGGTAVNVNGTLVGSMGFTYASSNPFRLTQIGGGPTLGYDANGSLKTGPGFSYDYTADAQLRSATVNGITTQYAYDADQWRIKKATAGGATKYFVRGPGGQLLAEHTAGAGGTVRDYVYAGGRLIAAVSTSTPGGGSLPSGWTGNDIGAVGFAGSAVESHGTYTVTASGADIWEYSDQYYFAWRQLTGDGSIVARVATLNAADPWAKAGVMMRESLAGGAKHGFSMLSTGNGLAFQRRVTTDDYTAHSWGPSGTAPQWVRLTRSGDSVAAYTSTDGVTWTLTDTDTIVMAATIYVGLAVTSHDNAATATATFDGVSVMSGPWTGLPAGWSTEDIGAVGVAGAATYAAGTFTVTGSGTDVWNTTDEFRYVYRPLTGDGTITARVADVEVVHDWTKAGVMIRESLAGGSRHAFMLASANHGLAFQRRVTTDDVSTHTAGEQVPAPRWVRLTRSGNTISAYSSADGAAWTLVDTDTIAMTGTVYVGLAVTSHDNTAAATATFTDVTVE